MHMFLEHKDIHYILTLHVNIAVFAYEKNKYSCHWLSADFTLSAGRGSLGVILKGINMVPWGRIIEDTNDKALFTAHNRPTLEERSLTPGTLAYYV